MAEFGSRKDGRYNELSKSYKSEPSIENYVRLRRTDPAAEIEISVIGGMEQLFFMEAELRKYGFDPAMIASVLDANTEAIGELSLQIMEKMVEAKNLAKGGQTHLARRGRAIPDKLVNWLIACMLDALSWNDDLYIPRDLIVLIRERLGGSNPEYEQASNAYEKRWAAITIGAQLKAQGMKPSFRVLARILQVSPSTVMRWFPDGDFEEEIERVARWFDEDGQVRDFKRPLQTK